MVEVVMLRTRLEMSVAVAVVSAVSAVGVVGGSAVAGSQRVADAPTTVTIKAEGTDLSGTVSSPKAMRCADGRKVIVIKQKGTRGGGDDEKFASDTASLEGDVYAWSTGTTGTAGRFYARVKPIDGCRGDTSNTIRARR